MELRAGQVAFITGGASGIGLGLARAFAERGLDVAIGDIDETALTNALAELEGTGASVEGVALDVTNAESWQGAADQVWERFGRVDVLCNNAGIGQGRRPGRGSGLLDLDELTWRTMFDINTTGPFLGVKTIVPRMIAAANGGHVVNTASMAGLIAPAGLGAYSATKYAVVAFSESLRAELAPHRIGVSVLCPGGVESNLNATSEARHAVARGTDPLETRPIPVTLMAASSVAERVLASIEANVLHITTHPEYRELVAERFDAVLAGFSTSAEPGYLDPEPLLRSSRNPSYAEIITQHSKG